MIIFFEEVSYICQQVCQTTTFRSTRTNQTFQMYHKTDCKSMFAIYLLECTICKLQYVGKSEPPFNIRLNNHRKASASKKETIVASRHFQSPGHIFNRDAKFTIIEKIKNSHMNIDDKRDLLRRRETFWISKLRTTTPDGLNQEWGSSLNTSSAKYLHHPVHFDVTHRWQKDECLFDFK